MSIITWLKDLVLEYPYGTAVVAYAVIALAWVLGPDRDDLE